MPLSFLSKARIQQTPYLWVCFAMIVGVMGTALASPLYPLYQQAWNLSAGDITAVYAVYMGAALCSLLFFGRISDHKGYIVVLRGGLVVVTIGIIGSAVATDYWTFLFSRIVIGLASSLILTSASIGLTQLNRSSDLQRAAATTSLLIAFGFGLGPVTGGLIAQWAPAPLRYSYVPSIMMGFAAIYALFALPSKPSPARSMTRSSTKELIKPSLCIPQGNLRLPFILGSLVAFCAFAMFSLFASLAPSFMSSMVPWHGPAVSGLSLGVILFLSSGFQLMIRAWSLARSLILGLLLFILSNVLLLINLRYTSALLFALVILVLAFGHALCLMSGMGIINRIAAPEHRSATTSSYLVIGYLGAIAPTLSLGVLADHLGLQNALIIFCISLMLLCAGIAAKGWQHQKRISQL